MLHDKGLLEIVFRVIANNACVFLGLRGVELQFYQLVRNLLNVTLRVSPLPLQVLTLQNSIAPISHN